MPNTKSQDNRSQLQIKGAWLLCLLCCFYCRCVEGRPTTEQSAAAAVARWANPCDLPPVPDLRRLLLGGEDSPGIDMLVAEDLAARTAVALTQAKRVLKEYVSVEDSFTDASFIQGTTSHRLPFLPKVTRTAVKDLTLKESVVYFYTVMQYYGVGLEQVITDQVLHDGHFFLDFRGVENRLAQVLCELQMSAARLRVTPNADVTRDVMKQQYRNVGSSAQRLIRNYLILRDYVHVLQVMQRAFAELTTRAAGATAADS